MTFDEEFKKCLAGLPTNEGVTAEEVARLSDGELMSSLVGVELSKKEEEIIVAEMKKRGLAE